MHKITKKLFCYFTVLLFFFGATAFTGFQAALTYYTYQNHERELKERAGTIGSRLETFLQGHTPRQGRGAYLWFVDDIAMADAYLVDADGEAFSYGRNAFALNTPTEEAKQFAAQVFASGSYEHFRRKDGRETVFYAGMPVKAAGKVAAAVILIDTAQPEKSGMLAAVVILGICMAAALALSALLSACLSRRFVKPIQQIAGTAKELAGGNYLASTDVHDQTELGELAAELDDLAQKLEAARQESSRLEQMQKDYISNISHELRTPVTVIRSLLEAVCDGVVTGEKAVEYERQVLLESISLQRLINDMLELTRLQNKDFPIEKADIDLLCVLEDAIRAVRVLASEKSIRILFEKPKSEWLMQGDYGRLRQMFVAALDNAIKYSAAGKQILVSAKIDTSHASISVCDHGCGIPQEEVSHIFERFYRSGNNHEKGSGLGLTIMKSIGERHEIDVSLQSTYHEGTTVTFRLSREQFCQKPERYPKMS